MGRCNLMNRGILRLLLRPVGVWALIVNGRQCPRSAYTWATHTWDFPDLGHSGKRNFQNWKENLSLWLHQLAKYWSSLLSECALSQWRGGTISCDTKPVSFPALGVGAARSLALPWLQGTPAVGARTMLSYFGGTKEYHTHRTTKLTNPRQIFSFCLKVPGNLW